MKKQNSNIINFPNWKETAKYILKDKQGFYYTGKGTTLHGIKVMVFSNDIAKAKEFTSYKRALKTANINNDNYLRAVSITKIIEVEIDL